MKSMSPDEAERLINEYGKVLERISNEGAVVCDESFLPDTKERIKEALVVVLKSPGLDQQQKELLKTGYINLSMFLPNVKPDERAITMDLDDPAALERHSEHLRKSQAELAKLKDELDSLGL